MRILSFFISFALLISCAYADVYYKVRRGDTLIKIAKKFGVSVKAIKRANRIRGTRIYAGQRLRIPVKRKRKKRPVRRCCLTKVPVYKYYRVRKGDSVSRIARKFHVPVKVVIRENHLRRPYIIRPGQRLKILVGYRNLLKLNRPIEFHFPLDGRVDPTIRELGYPGIFILSDPGEKVKASEMGIVKFAGRDEKLLKAYGKVVIMEHPKGFRTVYSNLDRVLVKVGQIVKRDEVIGTAGTSGNWGRSGIYFDISRVHNGKVYHLNPLDILK
jgi:murein DD-endopeptidase MepM/ murein hydrolase activator NlpD